MWILFFCICVFPVLWVFGLWYYRQHVPRASGRRIEMDGAVCILAEDSSVLIQPRTLRNWIFLIILIAFTVGISILIGLTFQDILSGESTWLDSIEALSFLILLGLSFAGISVYLALSLRMQPVTFNKNSQILEIGRGASTRRIPFSSISHLTKGFAKKGVVVQILSSKPYGIKVVLDDGEKIQIGTVSEYGKNSKASDRASKIIELIMGVIGQSDKE